MLGMCLQNMYILGCENIYGHISCVFSYLQVLADVYHYDTAFYRAPEGAKITEESSVAIDSITSACIVDRGQRRGPIAARWLSHMTFAKFVRSFI
jgi:hypothetical protein